MKAFLVGLVGFVAIIGSPLAVMTQSEEPGRDGDSGDVTTAGVEAGTLPPHGQDQLTASGTVAGTIDVGSDGSDGPFIFIGFNDYDHDGIDDDNNLNSMLIDLGLAASLCDCDAGGQLNDPCRWDCPSPVPGRGVYDAEQWAVVFKYSNVVIPDGKTVRFVNHTKRAPIVWLSQSSIDIRGNLDVSGGAANSNNGIIHEPGPGGFRGGRGFLVGNPSSGGFGPGGSSPPGGGTSTPGAYANFGSPHSSVPTVAYGKPYGYDRILPLIGGSGASGHSTSTVDGSGGGGAILLAANSSVSIGPSAPTGNASVKANGGSASHGGGSGGAIRIIAPDVVALSGSSLEARGFGVYRGGDGRIRVESITENLGGASVLPSYTWDPLIAAPEIWPSATHPTIRVSAVQVDGQRLGESALVDPNADLFTALQDVVFSTNTDVAVEIEARNVPLNWQMTVRIVPVSGATILASASPLAGGDQTLSMWLSTPIDLPKGKAAIQVRAFDPN